MSRVRSIIEDRFRILYKIDLGDHIKRVIKMGATTGEGFSFEPVDHKMFRLALQKTKKFFPDNGPYSHGDAIGTIAASATNGEGWREEGLLSLHCAIAPEVCSVHLDGVGFVLEGRRGKYGPDVINHIAHDLGWWSIVNAAYRQSSLLGDVLSRIHPHVLSGKNPDLMSFTLSQCRHQRRSDRCEDFHRSRSL